MSAAQQADEGCQGGREAGEQQAESELERIFIKSDFRCGGVLLGDYSSCTQLPVSAP